MQTVLAKFRTIMALSLLLSLGAVGTGRAQTVDELELLPPIGTTEPPSEAVVAEELVGSPDVVEPDASAVGWPSAALNWFKGPVWNFGSELGINGSEGNAAAFSILVGANFKRETGGNVFEGNLKYGKTQTQGLETQHFALVNSRWDRKFDDVQFLYNKNTLEYDEFKAFDVRLVLSGGYGYNIIKSETTTFTGRFGAGASREFDGPDDSWVPESNFGVDFERQITKRQKVKLVSDYYPAWEDYRDYRLITDASWEILLDEAANLSLKFGAIDRYDSTPNGLRHNDIDYFATLIWSK